MLVLRRKVGESIVLAGKINVSVLAVEGERVKIGISAPPEVTIVREELLRTNETEQPTTSPTPNQTANVDAPQVTPKGCQGKAPNSDTLF